MKYLITNADDFGWGVDITQGIVDAHTNGVLSSASVIINEIDEQSLEIAKNTPTLGLGLHLNIATGHAISNNWPYGEFSHPVRASIGVPYKQSMWEDLYGKYDTSDILEEFEAQLRLFQKLVGKLPDHLDTHYNTFCVASVFSAYCQLAEKYNLPVRHPVGYIGDTANVDFTAATSELVVMQDLVKELRNKKIKTTTVFSLEYINLHDDYIAAVLDEIGKIDDGESIEISFHPGYREDWRKKQVEILMDPALKKALESNNVKVINYAQL